MFCGVATFPFTSFMEDEHFRLVVQRTLVSDEDPEQESQGIFGTEYVYRCIITNDWSNSEKDIITYYLKSAGHTCPSAQNVKNFWKFAELRFFLHPLHAIFRRGL